MISSRSYWTILSAVSFVMIAIVGCGGTGSSSTPPPVEGVAPAPDAPFGGLGNPYNEAEKKTTKKKS